MISGKETFIARISDCLGRQTVTRPAELSYPHQMQYDYLAGADAEQLQRVFTENARAVGITVHTCAEPDLGTTLVEIVEQIGTPLILADHPFLDAATKTLADTLTERCQVWNPDKGREVNMARAEQARVGIGVAEMALAESGSSLIFSSGGSGRSVTLMPENSVIVVRADTISPRLTQAMEWLQKQDSLPASVNLISGPSSTADIELVRVQGVHGPLELIYVIVT